MPPTLPEDATILDEADGNVPPGNLPAFPEVLHTEPIRNAFTTLMSRKRSPTSPPSLSSHPSKSRLSSSSKPSFGRKDGLGVYISKPEDFPSSRVVWYDDDFVAIHDLYPKSSVHMLLLPRSPKYQFQHPFDALKDPTLLEQCREGAEKLKAVAGAELRKKVGRYSQLDAPREAILNGEKDLAEGEPMPEGRDWEKEIRVGIHAHPSMHHLHIHVISVDRHSDCLKHRKHYNSFATDFFVPLEDFPLAEDDVRRHKGYLKEDLRCWRCGKGFGNKFVRLKEHLSEEFKSWRRE